MEKEKEKSKKYSKDPETVKKRKERYDNDPIYREKMLERSRIRRRKLPAKIKQRQNESKRRKEDANYRIGKCQRGRIRELLVGKKKCAPTLKLLGCSLVELKTYLESLFQLGMSWENYGKNGWHIDHIIPCAAFDLSKPEEQHKCFHYTNLQPLWAIDNLRKGNKIIDYQI